MRERFLEDKWKGDTGCSERFAVASFSATYCAIHFSRNYGTDEVRLIGTWQNKIDGINGRGSREWESVKLRIVIGSSSDVHFALILGGG